MTRFDRMQWSRSGRVVALLTLAAVVLVVGACVGSRNRTADKLEKDSQQVQNYDNSLTFNAVTLEEFDDKGRLWWKVKAQQARYSKDKKQAQIQTPDGELYQDGQAILKVSAKTGEFSQKDKKLFLHGDIVAIDKRDGLTLKGNELEWQPRNSLLIVRDKLTGTHKQVDLAAKEGQYFTRERRLELAGQVVAITKDNLHLSSEQVTWRVLPQTLTSNRPVQVERYSGKTVTVRATANQGVGDLKSKTVTMTQNGQILFIQQMLQVASNHFIWSPEAQTVVSDQPVTVVNPVQRITMTGNQGRFDIKSNLAYLNGSVYGTSERKQAKLNTDALVWNLTTQQFEADGNVRYQQAGNPPIDLTGPKARGELQGQTVVVSGGRVETQFIP